MFEIIQADTQIQDILLPHRERNEGERKRKGETGERGKEGGEVGGRREGGERN